VKVAVLGAGAWGTALAKVLSANGHAVTLWARNPGALEEIVCTNAPCPVWNGRAAGGVNRTSRARSRARTAW
jgi:glycerol-3-phosphate dehydrogenase (NAD(P)+)